MGDKERVHLNTAHFSTFIFICQTLVQAINFCKSPCNCSASMALWRYCIIARKPASLADGTVETTMEEVSNVV